MHILIILKDSVKVYESFITAVLIEQEEKDVSSGYFPVVLEPFCHTSNSNVTKNFQVSLMFLVLSS